MLTWSRLCRSAKREKDHGVHLPLESLLAGGPGGIDAGGRFARPVPDRADDPYVRYVTTAPEFQPVRQDPAFLIGRWNTWIYMPWRYQWTIGTGEAGGRFCRDFGFNGGFTDHGEGPLDWLARWNLRFYNDHTAGKGDLVSSRCRTIRPNFQGDQRDPAGDPARDRRAAAHRRRAEYAVCATGSPRMLTPLRASPMRVAYALDDEISWGAFVTPLPWRINADDAAYQRWLETYYGRHARRRPLL